MKKCKEEMKTHLSGALVTDNCDLWDGDISLDAAGAESVDELHCRASTTRHGICEGFRHCDEIGSSKVVTGR